MIHDPFILIVDDDDMVRSIIAEYLETFGYKNLIQFKDGGSAVRYLQNPVHRVDLIISDWEMPELNGLGLLQAVRRNQQRKDTKFLMVTSQRSQERIKITRAALWKVDAYLVKPFRGNDLREKVLQLLIAASPNSGESDAS